MIGGGTRALGLGGGGFAVADSLSFNSLNPALLAYVQSTTIRMGGHLAFWETSAAEGTDSDSEVSWQDFRMFIPVVKRWTIGLGAEPTRRMDLQTFEFLTAEFNDPNGQNDAGTTYERRSSWVGSMADLRADNGFLISDNFALGLTFAGTFLHNERVRQVYFDDDDYRNVQYKDITDYRGWWIQGGFHARLIPRLSIGGFYKPRGEGRWEYELSKSDSDSLLKSERSGAVPAEYGVGIAWELPPGILIAADVRGGFWETDDMGIYADSVRAGEPQDPLFISLGIERMADRFGSRSVWNNWGYRGGVFYRRHYWPERQGTAVEDVGLALGVSIPVGHKMGKVHWAAEFGLRGMDEDKLGAQEKFMKLLVQIEISEKWFQRSRPRIVK